VGAAHNGGMDHANAVNIADVFADTAQQSDICFASNSGTDVWHATIGLAYLLCLGALKSYLSPSFGGRGLR
jgi:hypothetical protein